jgi:ketosteroid isomerase-like protein
VEAAVSDPAALVRRFYDALARRDAAEMAACYVPDVVFRDPAFGELHGDEARAMWAMLCARGKDLRVELPAVAPDGSTARWEARYTFSGTGRPVHNVIDARFTFRDGLIARHEDTFDLWRWAGMALGPIGRLLGWTPVIRNTIHRKARAGLDAWMARDAAAAGPAAPAPS